MGHQAKADACARATRRSSPKIDQPHSAAPSTHSMRYQHSAGSGVSCSSPGAPAAAAESGCSQQRPVAALSRAATPAAAAAAPACKLDLTADELSAIEALPCLRHAVPPLPALAPAAAAARKSAVEALATPRARRLLCLEEPGDALASPATAGGAADSDSGSFFIAGVRAGAGGGTWPQLTAAAVSGGALLPPRGIIQLLPADGGLATTAAAGGKRSPMRIVFRSGVVPPADDVAQAAVAAAAAAAAAVAKPAAAAAVAAGDRSTTTAGHSTPRKEAKQQPSATVEQFSPPARSLPAAPVRRQLMQAARPLHRPAPVHSPAALPPSAALRRVCARKNAAVGPAPGVTAAAAKRDGVTVV